MMCNQRSGILHPQRLPTIGISGGAARAVRWMP
jgi:hypothetical protein